MEGLNWLLGPWAAWFVNAMFLVPSFVSHRSILSDHRFPCNSPCLEAFVCSKKLNDGVGNFCRRPLFVSVFAHGDLWPAKGHEWTHPNWASRAVGTSMSHCEYCSRFTSQGCMGWVASCFICEERSKRSYVSVCFCLWEKYGYTRTNHEQIDPAMAQQRVHGMYKNRFWTLSNCSPKR